MKPSIYHDQLTTKAMCFIIVLLLSFDLNAVESDDDDINYPPSYEQKTLTDNLLNAPQMSRRKSKLPRSNSDIKPKNSDSILDQFQPIIPISSSSEIDLKHEPKRNPAALFRSKSDLTPKNTDVIVNLQPTFPNFPLVGGDLGLPIIHHSPPPETRIRTPSPPAMIIIKNWDSDDISEVLGWDILRHICLLIGEVKTISNFRLCSKKCAEELKPAQEILTATSQILKIQELGFMKNFTTIKDRHAIIDGVKELINKPEMYPDILMEDGKFFIQQLCKRASYSSEEKIGIKICHDYSLIKILDFHYNLCEFFLKADTIFKQYQQRKGTKSEPYKWNFLKVIFLISETCDKNYRQFSLFPEFASETIDCMLKSCQSGYQKLKYHYNPLKDPINSCFWSAPDDDPFWDFLSKYADFCQTNFLEYANEETSDFPEE